MKNNQFLLFLFGFAMFFCSKAWSSFPIEYRGTYPNASASTQASGFLQNPHHHSSILENPSLNRKSEWPQPSPPQLPGHFEFKLKNIDLTSEPENLWQRIRRGFAIQNVNSEQVPNRTTQLIFDPQRLRTTLEKAIPYLYHIVEELERRGLPTEIALLPFIESSFNPHATSRAGAAGLWQFIPSTGRYFNLKQNSQRDERRDVIASTTAALDYLSLLYEMYGDWHLALAAYNWGEGSVKRALEKNRQQNLSEDYNSLTMPAETRNYLPKLQAFKNIIETPEAFGINLPALDNKPYFVTVQGFKSVDIKTAAKLADMSLSEFRALNPGFKNLIPSAPGTSLLLPPHKADLFEENLQRYEGPTEEVLNNRLRGNSNKPGVRIDRGNDSPFSSYYRSKTERSSQHHRPRKKTKKSEKKNKR
jgi:Transglycosylase SLT domain